MRTQTLALLLIVATAVGCGKQAQREDMTALSSGNFNAFLDLAATQTLYMATNVEGDGPVLHELMSGEEALALFTSAELACSYAAASPRCSKGDEAAMGLPLGLLANAPVQSIVLNPDSTHEKVLSIAERDSLLKAAKSAKQSQQPDAAVTQEPAPIAAP